MAPGGGGKTFFKIVVLRGVRKDGFKEKRI